ncbi:RluA family pseudouridine synthase [Calditerrivibrio nitroreducens]|uniref:Pseudouridine synthase n=1 Tax=Calditerrivibrio nitroreducens (strain DSM 19672 / NBRC 101217 / Yu37-1) TaxID=768670 RepID=E4TGD5_CALNY|nr:RluA family pseudouridine synthase [Calditerrivibrio nitroreducens]ADR18616.1 pseudouridine synthase [Calditerrivibrio nitroreducens DSM 19672]
MNFEIVYDDDDILVVNKGHGLLVVPDRYDKDLPNLKDLLTEIYGRIFVVHRLDYGTSGIMVFAKNERSHRSLSIQFERSEVDKRYYAICKGVFPADLTCMLPISKVNYHGRYKINFKSGRKALTSFSVLDRFSDKTLIDVVPLTGRSHQIRVHLKALGYPLYYDFLYNEKREDKRLTLQAYYLRFRHPVKSTTMEFQSDISEFLREILKIS